MNQFERHIYFTKKERQGLTLLLALIIGIWVIAQVYTLTISHKNLDTSSIEKYSHLIQQDSSFSTKPPKRRNNYNTNAPTASKNKKPAIEKRSKKQVAVFEFDPNQLAFDSLLLLGIPKKIAHTIVNYREKGGQFRKKADIKKIYGMSDEIYQSLSSHIKIPPMGNSNQQIRRDSTKSPSAKKDPKKAIATIETIFIDINQSDVYEWMELKGIGPKKAEIIIEKRDRLGGFHSKEQLLDIWGIDQALYEEIAPNLIESPIYRPIDINQITQDSLAKHPLISYKKAMIICNYRKNHGPFNSEEDLLQIRAFSPNFVEKIAPYLTY